MILQVQCLEEDDQGGDDMVSESPQLPVRQSEVPDGVADSRGKKVDWSRTHEEQRKARQRIVLWRHPFLTLVYFIKELQIQAVKYFRRCSAEVERIRRHGCGFARELNVLE